MSIFWHKVWVEAGRPSAGVLFNIKHNTKSRFKYAVLSLKCRKEHLIREKFARSFTSQKKDQFWCEVRWLNRVRKSIAPCGGTGAQHIANLFSSRFESLFNKHPPSSRSNLLSSVQASLSSSMYEDISFTEDEVYDAIGQLRSKKSDNYWDLL